MGWGTRLSCTIVVASDRAEASYKFKKQYEGEFFTVNRVEEC